MHHHHHHHHHPIHTHHHTPMPPPPHQPPPPPPPPPPEVLEGDQSSGPPRCYYCGQLIPENQVARNEYHAGHGHKIFVFVCPSCRVTKKDGQGEFKLPSGTGLAVAIVALLAVGLVAYFLLVRPAQYRDITGGRGPWTGESGGLTLRVTKVEASPSRFRVWMSATNHSRDELTLPIFGYFHVIDQSGKQYEAEPFSSTFPRDVGSGATVSGYAEVRKALAPGTSRLKVGFSTVFGSFAVNSIWVEGIEIVPTHSGDVP